MASQRTSHAVYTGETLNHVAFPLGGLGAGMVCLDGTAGFSSMSLRHAPNVHGDSRCFSAVAVTGARPVARVLEAQVPMWKIFGRNHDASHAGCGNGLGGTHYGLPRFDKATFSARFPFATVALSDPRMPLRVQVTGWSPFVPGDADASSLPAAGVEYRFTNTTRRRLAAVYSFHAMNVMAVPPEKGTPRGDAVRRAPHGFILDQSAYPGKPAARGAFCAEVDADRVAVDCAMFRGGWFDPLTQTWRHIERGDVVEQAPHAEGDPAPGASLYVPFELAPAASFTIRLRLSWYVPDSDLRIGDDQAAGASGCGSGCACQGSGAAAGNYRPWYAEAFGDIEAVAAHWRTQYEALRQRSQCFADCFYDTTLPAGVVDAIAANLTILKSPTVLRQADGRLWGWEGCHEKSGCCHGSCTHVWNYAQSIPHLFPALERTLRETEFGASQDERGHQNFRSFLPIRRSDHGFHAAADGQLGGVMKLYREWRISGDTAWMKRLWPSAERSLVYGIETWDPDHKGVLEEPHHNTYDIEFWGPDGMCTSFYLGALQAAILMGRECGADVSAYEALLRKGRKAMETRLWNGEYFHQRVQWKGLRAPDPSTIPAWNASYSPEARVLLQKEGPKYQYGTGCLADGVLGTWLAAVCGLGDVVDPAKVAAHVRAVHRHNLVRDLSQHANPQRPGYALGHEGGVLLCTWPRGGKPALPFPYSDEVWTGIEYPVASHLALTGRVKEAVEVVSACRARYDGRSRNPFNEYECGHWYARAMSSYALLQSLGGARYDAVEKTLYLQPSLRGDYRVFLATATGYGTVGMKKGRPFVEVKQGTIDVQRIVTARTAR